MKNYFLFLLFFICFITLSCSHKKKWVDCERCDKSGYIVDVCTSCKGKGMLDCEACSTYGSSVCTYCGGRGSKQCMMCLGKGRERCFFCSGSGYDSSSGMECGMCFGRGYKD